MKELYLSIEATMGEEDVHGTGINHFVEIPS